jgi:hypothetical protein
MPPNRLARLPKWLSFWLGYRETPPPPQPPYIVWFWSFMGAFTGLAIIQAIFGHVPYFIDKGVPSIVSCHCPLLCSTHTDFTDAFIGSYSHSHLRRYRISFGSAPPRHGRPPPVSFHRDLHHQTVPFATDGGSIQGVGLACGITCVRRIPGIHADDRHDTSTCWYVSLSSIHPWLVAECRFVM